MNLRRTICLCLLAIAIALTASVRSEGLQQSGRPLAVPVEGQLSEQSLAVGESQEWAADLGAGEFLDLTIEPLGLVLEDADQWPQATVTGPDGAILHDSSHADATLSIDIGAHTHVSFVSKSGGVHRLRVAARHRAASPLRYRLQVGRRRFADAADERRLAAQALSHDGARLLLQRTPDARKTAIEKFEAARAIEHEVGDLDREAIALGTIATVYYWLSDPPHASEASARALEIWRRLGRQREEAITLSDLGLIAYLGYDHPKAKVYYEQALPMHRSEHDFVAEATTLVRDGWLRFAAGDLSGAIDVNQQALPLWRQTGSFGGESISLNDLGRAYADLGDVSQALDAYEQALALRSREDNPRGAAVVLLRMGQLHLSVADWQPAFDAMHQALALARRAKDVRNEAAVLSNLGFAYSRIGDSDEALRYLAPALTLARQIPIRNVEANVLAALGVEASIAGRLDESRDDFRLALAIQQAITDVRGQATTLRYLATTELTMGSPREALESITESLEKSEAGGSNASAMATLAAVRDALGETAEARTIYQRALDRARQIRARDQEASVLALFGRFEARHGRYAEAADLLAQAITTHESLRGLLADPDQRMSYASRSVTPYELYIDALMELDRRSPDQGFAAEAFRTSERARARGLLELLATSNVDIRQGVDTTLVERERSLRQNINAKAALQTALLARSSDSPRLQALEQEIATLSRSWRETKTLIRQQSPAYAALAEPQPLKAAEVGELLDANTVLLEIAPGDTRSWLFAATADAIEAYVLPGRATIEQAARDVHHLLTSRQPVAGETSGARQNRIRRADAALANRSAALSNLVLGPIAAKLATQWRGRRLAIVASGALEYIPFGALSVPAGAANRPLIAAHEIVTLQSASSLAWLRRDTSRRSPQKTVAVFADPVFAPDDPRVKKSPREDHVMAKASEAVRDAPAPIAMTRALAPFVAAGARGSLARLPFSRAEATAVAAAVPRASLLEATDFDATLALATSGRLADYRIVHFATHGLINTARPELSGLALSLVDAEGRSRDGFLRLNTIYNLRLSADLVVLSACQSALGKEVAGEGLVGLTRGFMYAGAKRVIASLWQVSDVATAELMKRFYANLLERHLPAAAALRRAQLDMSRDPRWAAPYFWAGFVLQGDWQQ